MQVIIDMYAGTEVPLTSGSTYTSMTRMKNRAQVIVGTVFADQAGTLHVEQSYDPKAGDALTAGSAAWDLDTTQAVVASTGAAVNVTLVAPFWRLRYVNGGTGQGTFRLHARATNDEGT